MVDFEGFLRVRGLKYILAFPKGRRGKQTGGGLMDFLISLFRIEKFDKKDLGNEGLNKRDVCIVLGKFVLNVSDKPFPKGHDEGGCSSAS